MRLQLGVKTDPVEYRYSYEWLFDLLHKNRITRVQLGSFSELFSLEDAYFVDLKAAAAARGIRIGSCFTSHRELGGFFTGNPHLEKVARRNYERFIEVGAVLGARYVGSNPGAVYRDDLDQKPARIACYLDHMKELMSVAKGAGLEGLTLEPMSSAAEPPSYPEEIDTMLGALGDYQRSNPEGTVPVYLCGDVSHGIADRQGAILHTNTDLFVHGIPHMAEFHFKNTDSMFNSTFGFGPEECRKGIVDLQEIRRLLDLHGHRFPVNEVIGYLEIGGPKLGRDYSDRLLPEMLEASIRALQGVFDEPESWTNPSICS